MQSPGSQPPSTSTVPNGSTFDKGRFRRLLGSYVMGLAVGCVLVGMMLQIKRYFRSPQQPAPVVAPAPAPVPAAPATPPPATPSPTPDPAP